ncbi:GL22786 [Drosophila persimilis]|uniref:GL22786 n=1 Tax=Drosophila persimilis TaxID=7234 RepID=B4GZK1_DROPE|nr:GL22786 [Drosophila persimilis]
METVTVTVTASETDLLLRQQFCPAAFSITATPRMRGLFHALTENEWHRSLGRWESRRVSPRGLGLGHM